MCGSQRIGPQGKTTVIRRAPLLIGLLAGVALAQVPEKAPAETAPANAASDFDQAPSISDGEKVRRSNDAVTRMRGVLKDVLGKLEEARNTRDIVKLNCVNEKLTQIKGLLRISEQSDVAMQEAIAKGEKQSSDHEYTKVSIA